MLVWIRLYRDRALDHGTNLTTKLDGQRKGGGGKTGRQTLKGEINKMQQVFSSTTTRADKGGAR